MDLNLDKLSSFISTFQHSLALWRLPQEHQFNLIADETEGVWSEELSNLPPGFVIAPFELPIRYFHIKPKILQTYEVPKIEKLYRNAIINPNSKVEFLESIQNALDKITSQKLEKVVLSRIIELHFDTIFDVFQGFLSLCAKYPDAFVSLVKLPFQKSYWLTATPELLGSQDNHFFKTMALAGTQPAFEGTEKILPSEARWTQKEIEEQAFVRRYIVDCFKKIRLREFQEKGPKTIQAGNLLHLKTDFEVDLEKTGYKNLLETMLPLLHPTSAVCGMPIEAALAFILKNERHSREFYSGFLGPVLQNNKTQIFVNLRTIKIDYQRNTGKIYVGCGITSDSNPEKEWNETEIKSQTILEGLGIQLV